MNEQIKFGLVTPCLNSEKTIEKTIENVLKQTYQNYKYVIVDGGSTDRTLDIIERYKILFGDKLTVISGPDRGIYDAMNKGIQCAGGDIVGIINSDDFYEVTALEKIKICYDSKARYQIIYGMMRKLDVEKNELAIVFYHHQNLNNQMICHPSAFVSYAIYRELGMYNLKYKIVSDYEFMLRMVRNKDVKFIPVYNIIANFTSGGISGTYIGIQETNDVKYEFGIVSKKHYWLTKGKNILKHYVTN